MVSFLLCLTSGQELCRNGTLIPISEYQFPVRFPFLNPLILARFSWKIWKTGTDISAAHLCREPDGLCGCVLSHFTHSIKRPITQHDPFDLDCLKSDPFGWKEIRATEERHEFGTSAWEVAVIDGNSAGEVARPPTVRSHAHDGVVTRAQNG